MTEEKTEASLSFEELDLAPEVLNAVRDAGYTHPTPIQQQAIPLALAGRDLIGLAQTGTGKTAGFTLPIVHNLITAPLASENGEPAHRVRVLILTPTRELAAQVEESFRKYGKHTELRVVPIYGGVGLEPQSRELKRGVDVVVATPGRLLDHMCRIWLNDVPPGQQPAPTDCASAVRNRPSNGKVLFGDEPKGKKKSDNSKSSQTDELVDLITRRISR